MTWLRNFLSRLETRSANLLVAFILSVVSAVVLVVVTVAALASGEFENVSSAIWWGFKGLLDTGNLDDAHNLYLTGVSLFAVLVGYVCINAGITATVVSIVTQRVESAKRGYGPVPFSDHIVILNHSGMIDEVVAELSSGNHDPRIAILVPDSKDECEARVLRVLSRGTPATSTVVFRTGQPQYREDLTRVNVQKARAVLMLKPATAAELTGLKQDMAGLKTLMVLDKLLPESVPVVVELGARHSLEHIKSLITHPNIRFLNGNRLIGWVLCDASLQPQSVRIYDELFSRWGNELYCKKIDWPAGRYSRQDFVRRFSLTYQGQIPIGLVQGEQVQINPDTWEIDESHRFIMLSVDEELPSPYAGEDKRRAFTGAPGASRRCRASVLIVGANAKLEYILEGYQSYIVDNARDARDVALNVEIISEEPHGFGHFSAPGLSVRSHVMDYIRRPDLFEDIIASGDFDSVVLLSDENVSHEEQDVNVLAAVVMINRLITTSTRIPKRPVIVAEVLDQHNEQILNEYRVPNVVVSNRLTSHLLARYLDDATVAPVYEQLLDYKGQEICVRPATQYFTVPGQMRFGEVLTCLAGCGDIALGFLDSSGVHLNPGFEVEVTTGDDLKFIVLSER